MVHTAGFEDVRPQTNFNLRFRGRRKGVAHTVVHARGVSARHGPPS